MAKLTDEQKDIVRVFKDAERLKINAFAGTGKTTTLRAIAKVYPSRRFLVLTFNKSISDELKSKLPSNCSVYTVHSLAYKFYGQGVKVAGTRDFTDRLFRLFPDDEYSKIALYRDVFDAFCNSFYIKASGENIGKIIHSNSDLKRKVYAVYDLYECAPYVREQRLSEIAENLASKVAYMFSAVDKKELPITHSYYLKKFQLNLHKHDNFFKRFNAILVDEGQDLNGIQEYILVNAPIPQKVIVGDKHQSIYSWRGAVNTLARLKEGWDEKALTVSFRFENKEIVEQVNNFLKNLKGESSRISAKPIGKKNNKTAYITRTNAKIVELISEFNKPFTLTRPIYEIFRPALIGGKLLSYFYTGNEGSLRGVTKYIQNLAKQALKKVNGETGFKSFFLDKDIDIAMGILIADKYDIESLYEKAKRLNKPDTNTILTTAHSSKGLEFDTVILTDDFPDLYDYTARFVEEEICELDKFTEKQAGELVEKILRSKAEVGELIDEINLQYVAVTRAIKNIKGSGYQQVMENFSKELNTESVMEAVRKRAKQKEGIEKSITAPKTVEEILGDLNGDFDF